MRLSSRRQIQSFADYLNTLGISLRAVTPTHKMLWLKHVLEGGPITKRKLIALAKDVVAVGPPDLDPDLERSLLRGFVRELERHPNIKRRPGEPSIPTTAFDDMLARLDVKPMNETHRLRLRTVLLVAWFSGLMYRHLKTLRVGDFQRVPEGYFFRLHASA
jgi:hypothetical protein